MRGLYGAPQSPEDKLSELIEGLSTIGKRAKIEVDVGFERTSSNHGYGVEVPQGAKFSNSGWAFKDPYTGQDYVKKFTECNQEELLDVVCVLFHETIRRQEEMAQLKTKLRVAESPALQLIG
jgi:hypothetical protein